MALQIIRMTKWITVVTVVSILVYFTQCCVYVVILPMVLIIKSNSKKLPLSKAFFNFKFSDILVKYHIHRGVFSCQS